MRSRAHLQSCTKNNTTPTVIRSYNSKLSETLFCIAFGERLDKQGFTTYAAHMIIFQSAKI